jgi:hypothetical protein
MGKGTQNSVVEFAHENQRQYSKKKYDWQKLLVKAISMTCPAWYEMLVLFYKAKYSLQDLC